jgi:predicted anti-sigma-YlaC factor YlaD
MNADSAHSRFPHLDLEDLIAEVTGRRAGDRAREHLASCEHCRAEASRWSFVADGVRGLAAATLQGEQPARPRRAGPRALAGSRRRAMLAASAAAALVLLGGAGYGVTAIVTGHATGTVGTGASTPRTGANEAVFTAISGCAGLVQASGTLDRVNGTSLVIKTAGGLLVTVTTTASTMVNISAAPLSDITDGAPVTVTGHSSGGTIAAFNVNVGTPGSGKLGLTTPPGSVAVQGTVSGVSTAGFTVVTSGGTQVRVTTSGGTVVNVVRASLSQLQAGATITAVGYARPDRTLPAIAVVQPPPGARGFRVLVVPGCSPASINSAIARALGS